MKEKEDVFKELGETIHRLSEVCFSKKQSALIAYNDGEGGKALVKGVSSDIMAFLIHLAMSNKGFKSAMKCALMYIIEKEKEDGEGKLEEEDNIKG